MAKNDLQVVKHPGPRREYLAEDRNTSSQSATMKPGEPVKVGGTGNNFTCLIASGDPVAGTDEFIGVVAKESDETSSANGNVEVTTLIPVITTIRGKATTSTDVDTESDLNGILGDWVTFSYDDTNFTIFAGEGSDPDVHGLKIVGGDINDYTVDVIVHASACEASPSW